jgi:hypothetical protein
MPRARAFTRADVERRARKIKIGPKGTKKQPRRIVQAGEIAPGFTERLAAFATGKVPEASRQRFQEEITEAIKVYRARRIADQQENPARIIAALKPGKRAARVMLKWLRSLPQSVRLPLRKGATETWLTEWIASIDASLTDLQKKRRHRGGNAGIDLRRNLIAICAEHLPDAHDATDPQRQAKAKKRERLVADILSFAAIKFPNEKKNRKRFTGANRQRART